MAMHWYRLVTVGKDRCTYIGHVRAVQSFYIMLQKHKRQLSAAWAYAQSSAPSGGEAAPFTFSLAVSAASRVALAVDAAACSTVSLPISKLLFAASARGGAPGGGIVVPWHKEGHTR